MSLKPQMIDPIPSETARVAHLVFPSGAFAMQMRDALGPMYDDQMFADLFPTRGQPAEAPWRLALVTVLQFIEGLSDRQAAQAVRRCIDWKYALSLELTDPGFHFSVLSEFRSRLIAGQAEERLLTAILELFKAGGWLKARGRQRSDSTHVLASIRTLNRLETVGETLRATLNLLAEVAPDWLRSHLTPEWFDRYSHRVEDYRLPQGKEAREEYAKVIGTDGRKLLQALEREEALPWLRELPAVRILKQVWEQQYIIEEDQLRWRKAVELSPAGERIESPYDPDARFGNKRTVTWTGYKTHVTETCDDDTPHLITDVQTTVAHVPDVSMTEPIEQTLASRELLPQEHLLDAGYVDADMLVRSQRDQGIEIIGPVRPDSSWQAQSGHGYDLAHFTVDWEAHRVVCPQGHLNTCWTPHEDAYGNPVISVKFSRTDCRLCPTRSLCTRSAEAPRHVTLRVQTDHEMLQRIRERQATPEWKARYDRRAGIEGTLSQGLRVCDLRQARYVGLAKTHLQHVITAVALNCLRVTAWINGKKRATTRRSRFAALAG